MAFHTSPEVTCTCPCHGPVLGFFHCFGDDCCEHPDVARNAEVAAERKASAKANDSEASS